MKALTMRDSNGEARKQRVMASVEANSVKAREIGGKDTFSQALPYAHARAREGGHQTRATAATRDVCYDRSTRPEIAVTFSRDISVPNSVTSRNV